MKRVSFIIFLSTSCLIGFSQPKLSELRKAFNNNSDSLYEDFITKWHSVSTPISNQDYNALEEIDKDIYSIFQDFYNPFNLERIGPGQWGADFYMTISNVIVQNEINYRIMDCDSLNFDFFDTFTNKLDSLILIKRTLPNFRPLISFENKRILFLTPKYDKLLNQFLGKKHLKLGFGGIMNHARAKGKSREKMNFLNTKLLIVHGHWGGYWHINTHPHVTLIEFNRDRNISKVHYRLLYQGGEATYIKKGDKWVFYQAGLTWIE